MKNSRNACNLFIILAMIVLELGVICLSLSAQQGDYAAHTSAIDPANSRAEQEAESLVALSAEKIIELLQQEPGLLLQVKKVMVRKAYEQGRLLDPADLTDEALFRILRQDETVRVLASREIVERGYIRVKPNRREMERQQAIASGSNQIAPLAGPNQNQENTYWSQHEAIHPNGNPVPAPPQTVPQKPPVRDRQRELQMAEAQVGDYSTGLPLDFLNLPNVNPDQFSALRSASSGSSSSSVGSENTNGEGGGAQVESASLISGNAARMGSASPASIGTLPAFPGGRSIEQLESQQQQADQALANTRPSLNAPGTVGPAREQPQHLVNRRPNPYADIPSLYDLNLQYSRRSPALQRFGNEVFQKATGNIEQLPMDVPAGPDYVLGPGDGISIDLFGGVSQRLRRIVDREGRVSLPEIGGLQVAGRTLSDVQNMVQSALRSQFRNVQVDVSLSRLRTVRVYVVGDVQNPGAYDISSLSTPLNALYAAGGPTSRGSLRTLKHFRGKEVVQTVDVYDLLLHGVRSSMQRLEAGDTILVPPIGAEVAVQGMVRRPAIYELNGEKSLAEVLEVAGGVLPSGTLRHIDVERVVAHDSRTMLGLDIPENNNQQTVNETLEKFQIQDGDQIKISPIVAFAEKTVYLDGHVFRPGKYAYRDGMKVSDLIGTYQDLLPEPYRAHAEVIRLKAPDYTPEVIAFNLEDALAGKDQDIALKPLDTVRVFGRFDFEDQPVITVTGEVRDPGDHVTNGATYLRDAIYLAGNTTSEARLDDVQIFRRGDSGELTVLSVNLGKALAGDSSANIMLVPKDRVFVQKNLSKTDPPQVTIQGEVAHPGKYPLGDNMTATDLVRVAGGLKRSAYAQQADLTRFMVEHGEKIVGDHEMVQIAAALAGEPDTNVRLHDGDVLSIRQLSGWNNLGATIVVQGEVAHPGTYGVQEGERLSSILERAGGFRPNSYPYGAIFQRVQVRDLEEKNRAQLIRQVETEGPGLKAVEDPFSRESASLQWKNTLDKLQNTPPPGRMVVHITGDVKRWANTANDIQVHAGDTIYIPRKPTFVMVDGAVYNPTAVTFKPGKSAGWYLRQSGGPTSMANKRATFVVRADGTVVGGSGGLLSGGATDVSLHPGDMVVVPDKPFGGGLTWKNTLQVAQLVSAVGIAVQVARGF
jgi:polysaccharide export outer membrane protein